MKLINKNYNYDERIKALDNLSFECQLEINELLQLKSANDQPESLSQEENLNNIIKSIENTLETAYINRFGEACLNKEDLHLNLDYQTLWNIYEMLQNIQ